MTPDRALAALKEGNAKFVADTLYRGVHRRERRLETARQQAPFALLVSCSDRRVSSEFLFGRGFGEQFIVRNASNTVDTVALGSSEYAVAVLGGPLIVVPGHERCGAVDAHREREPQLDVSTYFLALLVRSSCEGMLIALPGPL